MKTIKFFVDSEPESGNIGETVTVDEIKWVQLTGNLVEYIQPTFLSVGGWIVEHEGVQYDVRPTDAFLDLGMCENIKESNIGKVRQPK